MKTILYVRTNDLSFDPRAQKEIYSLLSSRQYNVLFLGWNRTPEKGSPIITEDEFPVYGLNVHRILINVYGPWGAGPRKNARPILSFFKNLKKWVKSNSNRFDFAHLVDLPGAYPVFKILKRKKIPFVYDIFDFFPDLRKTNTLLRKLFVSMEKKVTKASAVTIICDEGRRKQISMCHPKQIAIINNAPLSDAFDYRRVLKNTKNRPRFVYVGNLCEERLLPMVLDYFAKNDSVELHIGGVGPLAALAEEYAKKSDNITFYGKLDYNSVLSLEKDCFAFVALYDPSIQNHRYVSSNKFYEAMSLGKKLIMVRNTGSDLYFQEHNMGVLIDPTEESFGQGVETLVKSFTSNDGFSQELINLFQDEFQWSIMGQRLVSIYNQLSQDH